MNAVKVTTAQRSCLLIIATDWVIDELPGANKANSFCEVNVSNIRFAKVMPNN